MCHYVFMYDGRDKNTNSQTNGSIKFILIIYGGVMQYEIYSNQIIINMYFIVDVKIFNK